MAAGLGGHGTSEARGLRRIGEPRHVLGRDFAPRDRVRLEPLVLNRERRGRANQATVGFAQRLLAPETVGKARYEISETTRFPRAAVDAISMKTPAIGDGCPSAVT